MKNRICIVLSLIFMMTVFAGSASASEDPNRVTPWNRMTDFFATVGKDKEEKKSIKDARKKNRRASREFESRQKQNKKSQKQMQKQEKVILEKIHTRKSPHGRGGIDGSSK